MKNLEMPDIVYDYVKNAPSDEKWVPNCDVLILCLTVRHLHHTIKELREIIEKIAMEKGLTTTSSLDGEIEC